MKRFLGVVFVLTIVVGLFGVGAAGPAMAQGGEGVFGLPAGSIDHLEPTLAYTAVAMRIEFFTATTLVTFRDAAGEEGKEIIGGIAELPEISEDGLTYTFTLKPGIKFADGSPITAQCMVRTFERIFTPDMGSPAAGFFTDIVGAEEFAAGEAKSIEGIKVDGDKVIFQLKQPVGSLLSRLTMPFTVPVPENTPATPFENGELLTSGPYMVDEYEPNRLLTLIRNPNYAADVLGERGKMDKIVIQLGVEPAQAGLMIRANEMDLYLDRLAPADAAQAMNDPMLEGRVFANPQAAVLYLWMNNDVPPFDNVKVRQAVNYAVNRNAILRVWGGPSQGSTTDQILPPTMPGWGDADLYPMGGDVEMAKKLLAESGVSLPIETTLRTMSDQAGFVEVAQAVQKQLKEVGINVNIEAAIDSVNEGIVTTRANRVPMGINPWYQDYPDPDNFINTLLDGTRITDTSNQNKASFNAPAINDRMHELQAYSGADRFIQYLELDVEIIRDYAPWAPLLNPIRVDVVSDRVTDYVYHPVYGPDLTVIGIKQ